jgi:hypothetical protein
MGAGETCASTRLKSSRLQSESCTQHVFRDRQTGRQADWQPLVPVIRPCESKISRNQVRTRLRTKLPECPLRDHPFRGLSALKDATQLADETDSSTFIQYRKLMRDCMLQVTSSKNFNNAAMRAVRYSLAITIHKKFNRFYQNQFFPDVSVVFAKYI